MIREVTDPKEIWKLEPFFRDVEEVDETAEQQIAKCILGHYRVIVDYDHETPQSVAVWFPIQSKDRQPGMFLVLVSARNNMRQFYKALLPFAKERGVTFWRAWTKKNTESFCRLLDAKPLTTVVEGIL